MVNEFKSILLVHGLQNLNDYNFEMIKSLLASDLKLTPKMQQEYNRIKIADLMAKNFQGAACVEKLIELIKNIPELEELANELRRKKLNAARKLKAKEKTPEKKKKPKGAGPAIPAPPADDTVRAKGPEAAPVTQKRKGTDQEKTGTKRTKVSQEQIQPTHPGTSVSTTMGTPPPAQSSASTSFSTPSAEKMNLYPLLKLVSLFSCFIPPRNQKKSAQHKAAAKKSLLQKGPMKAMVVKASELFEYDCPEKGKGMMFHATVANERQFFHVKVLNINLKEKFTKEKVIILSDYFECKGILEVNNQSSVTEAGSGHQINVPKSIWKRANETPKIDSILKQASGTFVYGLFEIHKIKVNKKTTIYEIQDNTGNMAVVGSGKWHNINCKEGDKFRLFYFQLRTIDKKLHLMCENHSFLQVVKTKKKKATASSTTDPNFQSTSSAPDQLSGLNSDTIKMVNEYKKIILLHGLQRINDYHFRLVKSLLASELRISQTMQEEYDRIKFANLMEAKFQGATCVDKLIEVIKDIPELKDIVKKVRREKLKGNKENPKPQMQPKEDASRNLLQKGPVTVMVLKATELFKYMTPENRENTVFHATVATETDILYVKVFNTHLKKKFTSKKIITISDYFKHQGFLEVRENSSVIEVDQKFNVLQETIRTATKTPQISTLHTQTSGTIVNGLFTLNKKTVNKENTVYEIEDRTGKMDVIGKRYCHNITCEEGDKLQLICFRLQTENGRRMLVSETHSFIQVKQKIKQRNSESMRLPQELSQFPATSATSTALMKIKPHKLQWPPPNPPSSSLTKRDCPSCPHEDEAIAGTEWPSGCYSDQPTAAAVPGTPRVNENTPSPVAYQGTSSLP
ncbi:Myeloid cell nuclear differentiation antigen, partial [Galemys pyrenaicus]